MPAAPSFLYRPAKRLIDLCGASVALGLTAPLMAAAAVAVRVSMGAPILFRQQRPGLGGRPFDLLKFRTMRQMRPGEALGVSDGARMTRVGRALRRSSIDELPSLINVLRGELSLVGPRPLLMRYLERYSPAQARRHEVKPGVTGWAQVNGRNALGWEQKFEHDQWYVDHRSLALDFKILALTVLKVMQRRGIESQGQATTTEFMGTLQTKEPAS